ncbi:MAG: FtsW/RodA/SpoVE family cell cycle protein, partial [Candidatus Electryoneaceae bacterium]|nr:FtsW/RodA/SpoVE family cell cycle protein [Candidatus Electryoneaceae bacterium]
MNRLIRHILTMSARINTTELRRSLEGLDYTLIFSVIGLLAAGLILIYSADHAQETSSHFHKQLTFSFVGLVILAVSAAIPGRFYFALTYVIYALALIGLILVPVAGAIGFGAKRWIVIAGLPFQPSEPAKLAFILIMARMLSRRYNILSGWKLVLFVALTGLPFIGLVLLQPDLGTSTVFVVLALALLVWHGLPLK